MSCFSRFVLAIIIATFYSVSADAAYTYKNVRIPSLSSDSTGLFLRISVPKYKRYDCGAPVVIYINGGFGAAGMLASMFTMSNYGFIVVEFNFPGGGSGTQKSGGVFDNRGPNCLLAIKDVISFSLGKTTDLNGKHLHEITGTKSPLYDNVGVIGGSNGGCSLLAALGIYHHELNTLAWVSFFESPIGDGMLTADAGKPYGHSDVSVFLNSGYDDSTGNYNWDIFKIDMTQVAYIFKRVSVKGVFYFDINNNNLYDPGVEFNLLGKPNNPYTNKYFYSLQVVRKAYEKGYYPLANPPVSFADSTLTKEYWEYRNGDNWIDSIMAGNPNLRVLFMVRDSDHITSAPNHPEVLITWNRFNQADCSWFRVNSDKSYIEYITGMSLPTAPDNNANTELDNINIRNMIMPGNIFPDRYMNHYSAALEMADRVINNAWSENLVGLLPAICDNKFETEEEDNEMLLYPNPASNEIYLPLNAVDYSICTIKVFDILGKQVLDTQIENVVKGFNLLIVDLNKLSTGEYFIKIDALDINRTLVFIKE